MFNITSVRSFDADVMVKAVIFQSPLCRMDMVSSVIGGEAFSSFLQAVARQIIKINTVANFSIRFIQ